MSHICRNDPSSENLSTDAGQVDLQILGAAGTETDIIEATGIGVVQMVKKYRIDDWLDRNALDIRRAQERERDRASSAGDRVRDVHDEHLGSKKNASRSECWHSHTRLLTSTLDAVGSHLPSCLPTSCAERPPRLLCMSD